jgi:phospholipid transport system substrate-binding protein
MTKLPIACWLLLIAAGASAAHGATAAAESFSETSATAFLEAHDARVGTIVMRDPTDSLSAAERDQVRALIREAFDFRELSRQSLGDAWEARSEQERDEFVEVYRCIIEESNLDMFVRYHRDGGISYTSAEIDEDGRATVNAQVPIKKGTKVITYSLHRPTADQEWRIFDLTVDGASTVAGNRRSWTRYISRNSYEKLLQRLREKLATLEGAG